MKKMISAFLALTACSVMLFASTAEDSVKMQIAAIENSLTYQTGTITFESCKAKMDVPEGFRYLDPKQARFVLTDLWGNLEDTTTLGLLVPANHGVLEPSSWVFTINFEKIGYVKDGDASDINYNDLLKQLQKEISETNAERIKLGYSPIELVGWASSPHYDSNKKVLHWAKELKFGADSINTLNYNLRVLGKDGVFILNAVASMSELNEVKPNIDKVLASIDFEKGSTYFDFDPKVDNVAAWTIGGLVAGKVLAKVGFFAIIAKFVKVIFIALAALGAGIWKFISGKKKDEKEERRFPANQ